VIYRYGTMERTTCDECGVEVKKKNQWRHNKFHKRFETLHPLRRNPRASDGDQKRSTSTNSSREENFVIRRAARRLYTLESVWVPYYAQRAAIRKEFPTLSVRTTEIMQLTTKTVFQRVREELKTAAPYIRKRGLATGVELGAGTATRANLPTPAMEAPLHSQEITSEGDTQSVPEEEELPPPDIEIGDLDDYDSEVITQPTTDQEEVRDRPKNAQAGSPQQKAGAALPGHTSPAATSATALEAKTVQKADRVTDKYTTKKDSHRPQERELCPTLQTPPQPKPDVLKQSVKDMAVELTCRDTAETSRNGDRRDVVRRESTQRVNYQAEKRKRNTAESSSPVCAAQGERDGKKKRSMDKSPVSKRPTGDRPSRTAGERARDEVPVRSRAHRVPSEYTHRSRSTENMNNRRDRYRRDHDWRPNSEVRRGESMDSEMQSYLRRMDLILQKMQRRELPEKMCFRR